jgi:hypothetical protein
MKRNPKQMMQQLQVHSLRTAAAAHLQAQAPNLGRVVQMTDLRAACGAVQKPFLDIGLHGPTNDAAARRAGEPHDHDEGDEQDGLERHVPRLEIITALRVPLATWRCWKGAGLAG